MKKGKSYIVISDITHPSHILVKALLCKGYSSFELIYASHLGNNAGWSCDGYNLPTWLGFTKRSALKTIEILTMN